jgi:tRNA (cmo5U34)-methyltransferase
LSERDTLFSKANQKISAFQFDEATARVFDDMVSRSVPLYRELQEMTVDLTRIFAKSGTRVYDLGCSTGTTLLQLAQACGDLAIELIGVDSSEAMLERARQKLAAADCLSRCILKRADLESLRIENASVILMILVLQFIKPALRESLIQRLVGGLLTDGALILVEKTVCEDLTLNRTFIEQHHEFKRRQGYSELEIVGKRDAIENVLIPFRLDEDVELLKRNGLQAEVFLRWYNFAGIVGVKRPRH